MIDPSLVSGDAGAVSSVGLLDGSAAHVGAYAFFELPHPAALPSTARTSNLVKVNG